MTFMLVKTCIQSLRGSFLLPKFQNFIGPSQTANLSLSQKCLEAIKRPPKTHPYPFQDKTRCHFPRPKEVKRIGVHGWNARMATNGGRRVLMRRILKGRHCLSH